MNGNKTKDSGKGSNKLTPQRQMLVDMILENLENGAGLWKKGWRPMGAPQNAVTGKKYRGVNSLFLNYISMQRGYSDNRWLTFNQMKAREWSFKTDEEGNSLGKKAGVSVEFYELFDRETKKKFDRSVLDGMSFDERAEYMDENVYPVRKYYTVFNGDLIEGIPEREKALVDESGRTERTEKFLEFWSENESRIVYGGGKAFYSLQNDEIHLPSRDDFYSMQEFYSTALHELGHSTGHEKRLNRDMSGEFGSESYAMEELRAEIASMFMEQDFEISVNEEEVRNNSAYIENWKSAIKDNPNVLFTAVADAEKISKYVSKKEFEMRKEVEPYSVMQEEDEYGSKVYRIYMAAENGQTQIVPLGAHSDRELVMKEFEEMQRLPQWADKRFKEVGIKELELTSKSRAEKKASMSMEPVEEETSKVYMLPSVAAGFVAESRAEGAPETQMRGKESLTRMDDREVVEQAERARDGETFTRLYNGEALKKTREMNEYALMLRIGLYADGTDQLLRVFKSSGQYDPKQSSDYYANMAKEADDLIKQKRAQLVVAGINDGSKTKFGLNAKS